MKVKEIRELTEEQLEAKIIETKDEIFALRLKQATSLQSIPSKRNLNKV